MMHNALEVHPSNGYNTVAVHEDLKVIVINEAECAGDQELNDTQYLHIQQVTTNDTTSLRAGGEDARNHKRQEYQQENRDEGDATQEEQVAVQTRVLGLEFNAFRARTGVDVHQEHTDGLRKWNNNEHVREYTSACATNP